MSSVLFSLIYIHQDSIVARVFKSKYFSEGNFVWVQIWAITRFLSSLVSMLQW
jgi:hypothetical protein